METNWRRVESDASRRERRLARLGAAGLAALAAAAGLTTGAWAEPPQSAGVAGLPESPGTVVRGLVVQGRRRPTDTPPPLDAYATPARYEQIALSPSGGQIAFVTSTQGMRLLVAYRFADRTRRVVKLLGVPTSIAWADDDHVLVTASLSALRGTCDAGDERAIEINAMAADAAMQSAMSAPDASAPSRDGPAPTPDSQATRGAILSLQGSVGSHPCIYYGVREQSAVTSVDLNRQSGRGLGQRMGDYGNRPLGTPELVSIAGRRMLAGPFLELRTQASPGEPAERVYLWSIDPTTGDGRPLQDGGGDISRERYYADDWLLSPQGEPIARSGYDFRTGLYSIQMKLNGAWKPVFTRAIVAKDHTFAPSLIGLGRDGRSIVVLDQAQDAAKDSAKDSGATAGGRVFHFYELTPDGRLSGPLEPGDAASDRPMIDAHSGRVTGFVEGGAAEGYVSRDPELQALFRNVQQAVPGETVSIISTADDPRKMILYAHGVEDPGAYYFADFATGAHAIVGDDYPLVPTDWFAAQSQISYTAADGFEIEAQLTLPPKPKAQNLPLVVLPHDGLQAHGVLGFDWLAQALASRGYLVLQPDVRGSDGHDRAYQQAGYGQLGRKMSSDLADGVRYLVSQGLADPKRVCVLGVGWGGYAALTAAADSSTFRCAGSINGVSDPARYAAWLKSQQAVPEQDQITPLAADTRHARAFGINPASPQVVAAYAGDLAKAPSPLKQADGLAVPVLLIHARGDKVAPWRQGRELDDALQGAHKDVAFVELKGDDHALTTKEARLATLEAVTDFLAKHDPAD